MLAQGKSAELGTADNGKISEARAHHRKEEKENAERVRDPLAHL